ncbi:MAG: tRNA lysidine(34) synthetase TilS [Lentisphaeria bacterium]|nr:tRNA lysidine(34) synthetase TilS [Candidatus Neomarinimicrobiota bacterium]MCF7841541.1 tRNA lysidine(34) synthetase TilS [Lentisphaeria bacterium]
MSQKPNTTYTNMLAIVRGQPWIRSGLSVLVASSGGVDSMLLLKLLADIPELRLGIAHLDHGLRGKTAIRDAEFVGRYATRMGIPFHTKQVTIAHDTITRFGGVESAARYVRYQFLESVRVQSGYDVVATGHTGSDFVETVLLNIYRGTGVLGLRGIRAMSDILVRPLLPFTRPEIEHVADELGLAFCTDETNTDWRFSRNRIRHGLLFTQSPDIQQKLLREVRELAHIADSVGELVKESVKSIKKHTVKAVKPGKILLDMPQGSDYFSLLWKALFDKAFQQVTHLQTGISERHFERLMAFKKTSQAGQYFQLPAGCKVYRDRKRFVFLRDDVDKWETMVCEPGDEVKGTFFNLKSSLITKPETLKTPPFIQYHALPRTSLQLRPWRSGDRVQPFGETGHCKVSDVLQAGKVAPHLKRWWPVLEMDGRIVWIPGVKACEPASIGENSQTIVKWEIAFEPESFE